MRVKVLFMGTPHFAVPMLERLAAEYEIVGVITQPDRPAGRGLRPTLPPVKEAALAHDLLVLQPASIKDSGALEKIKELNPSVIVVAAYGRIIPASILDLVPRGVLNVHPSLLPKYRGASPIPAAILAGEEKTGVTIMLLDEDMDSGPILAQAEEPILPEDTAESLGRRLSQKGAELLLATLPQWLAGKIEPRPQDHSQATYTKILKKEDGLIDWSRPAEEIARRVRAYHPWPGSYAIWQGRRLKILSVRPEAGSISDKPGKVVDWEKGAAVATGSGLLVLSRIQLEGRQPVEIPEFLRGHREFIGSALE